MEIKITIEWLQKYGCEIRYLRAFAGKFGKETYPYNVIHWLSPPDSNCIHSLNHWEREELKSWLLSREVEMAKKMLEHRASCIHDHEGKPLFLAISEGNLEMTIFLLENGASPHFPNGSGLYEAAEKGYFKILKALIEYGAGSYKEIVSKIILENKHPEIIKFLIDYRKKEN